MKSYNTTDKLKFSFLLTRWIQSTCHGNPLKPHTLTLLRFLSFPAPSPLPQLINWKGKSHNPPPWRSNYFHLGLCEIYKRGKVGTYNQLYSEIPRMAEKYTLNWNTFTDHLQSMFKDHFEQDKYSDVTLVSDDQTQFKAHKIVLSALVLFFAISGTCVTVLAGGQLSKSRTKEKEATRGQPHWRLLSYIAS